MKQLITILLSICILITACQVKKASKNSSEEKSSSKVDTYMPDSKDKSFKFLSNEFESIYEKFITDSIFQIAHIKFPVKGCYSDYDGDIEWTRDKWNFMQTKIEKVIKETSDSIIVKQDTSNFSFGLYCLDCGFSFEMEFNKFNDTWYLTHRQENNY